MFNRTSDGILVLFALVAFAFSWSGAYALVTIAAIVAAVRFFKIDQLDSARVDEIMNGITIIGHRGCSADAPENTVAAIRLAKSRGAQAVEFDVAFTKDGVAILMHDSTLDRTTNLSGAVEGYTCAEIQRSPLRHPSAEVASRYSDERVPTLEEAILECRRLGLKMFLDLKGSRSLEMSRTLSDLQQRHGNDLHHHAIVCSFYPQTIYAVRRRNPEFITALTHRRAVLSLSSPDGPVRNREFWKRLLAPVLDAVLETAIYGVLWYICGTSLFLINEREVSARQKAFWKERNILLVVWTVNDETHKKFLKTSLSIPYMTDACP